LVLDWKFGEKTKQVRLLVGFYETGRVTVMKGSKVTDYFRQVGHVTFDLYCPTIRSVIID